MTPNTDRTYRARTVEAIPAGSDISITVHTHGGPRPNAGRKPLAPEDPTESHAVTLPAGTWRMIEQAGDGNRSAGLRRLLAGMETDRES